MSPRLAKAADPGASYRLASSQNFLLICLTLLFLVPIWIFKYFPSTDGPSHLYNTWILTQWRALPPSLARFYDLNLAPNPNWIATAILYVLMLVVKPLIAEKVLLTICFVLTTLCWRYWILSVPGSVASLGLLGPLLASNMFLYMGFYSYCLSLPLLMLTLGCYWRRKEDLTTGAILLINLLLILTYFAHFLSLGLALVVIVLAFVTERILRKDASIERVVSFLLAIAASVPGVLYYMLSSQGDRQALQWSTASDLFWFFIRCEWLVYASDSQKWISAGLMLLLLVFSARTLLPSRRRQFPLKERVPLLVGMLAVLLTYVAAPRGLQGGWFLNERLAFCVIVMLAPLLSGGLGVSGHRLVATLILLFSLAQAGISWRLLAHVNTSLERYVSVASSISAGSTLLPLRWDDAGDDPARVFPLEHAAAYIAMERQAIDLGNYEAKTRHFQIRFRTDAVKIEEGSGSRDKPPSPIVLVPSMEQLEFEPASIDFSRIAPGIDYLVTWNLSETAPRSAAAKILQF